MNDHDPLLQTPSFLEASEEQASIPVSADGEDTVAIAAEAEAHTAGAQSPPERSEETDLGVLRIQDYAQDAMLQEDSHQAAIGVMNAGLMNLSYRYTQALYADLERQNYALAAFTEHSLHLRALAKLTEGICRYSDIERKATRQPVDPLLQPRQPLPPR